MNIFELKIWDNESVKCTFYTVHNEGYEENETDDFFQKYYELDQYKEQTLILLNFILDAIGNKHGAVDDFFNRNENQVDGLPSKGKIKLGEFKYFYPNFPLRIYALKVNENLVILFNGGIKDGKTNQESSLHLKWIEACNYAKRILEALQDGTIQVDEDNNRLINFDGSSSIFL